MEEQQVDFSLLPCPITSLLPSLPTGSTSLLPQTPTGAVTLDLSSGCTCTTDGRSGAVNTGQVTCPAGSLCPPPLSAPIGRCHAHEWRTPRPICVSQRGPFPRHPACDPGAPPLGMLRPPAPRRLAAASTPTAVSSSPSAFATFRILPPAFRLSNPPPTLVLAGVSARSRMD